jgi:hypothetical protein
VAGTRLQDKWRLWNGRRLRARSAFNLGEIRAVLLMWLNWWHFPFIPFRNHLRLVFQGNPE